MDPQWEMLNFRSQQSLWIDSIHVCQPITWAIDTLKPSKIPTGMYIMDLLYMENPPKIKLKSFRS